MRHEKRHAGRTVAALAVCVSLLSAPAVAREMSAGEVLAASGVKGGLVVHLGCGDGKLTAALRANESYLVHGLDTNAANVAKAREHIRSLGLYGPVSVERLRGDRLPYADNLVNLVVSDSLGEVPVAEVTRVLAPLGVAMIGGKKTVKPWPPDIDEWTHYLHDASGNAVAKDRVVGPPRRVQWVEGPLWQRHHEMTASPNALVSAKGRIFYICDEAPATVTGLPDQWVLIGRDGFSGVLLWKRPIREWGWTAWSSRETGGRFNLPVYIPRRLVAVGDRLYVTLGFNAPLAALDAATGKTVKTYDGTEFTDEIMCRDGLLILSVNTAPQKPGLISENPPVKKRVVALRADTGEILWQRGDCVGIASKADAFERITHLSLAVGREQVFFLEEDAVVGLDRKTGRELWRTPRPEKKPARGHIPYKPPNLCTLVAHQDVALFAQPEEPYSRKTWNRGVKCLLTALSAATGNVLWTQPSSKWGPGVKADVFAIDGLVWTHAPDEHAVIGIDLHSGEIKRTFSTQSVFSEVHHHRCFRNKATERYLLTARRGIEFLDLEEEQCQKHHWVRGTCRYGILPCNGLVYVPPHPCQCYVDVKVSGFYALAPASAGATPDRTAGKPAAEPKADGPEPQADDAPPQADRLERGPAFSEISNPESQISNAKAEISHLKSEISKADWPTYRSDTRRSGSTTADVPANLTRLWQADLGGRVSACTVVGGTVFAASIDEHRLCALDAKDGTLLWDYTAGGRVDTPPTVHNGLALFGSADGWVYALRASDGKLAWRFRAAPRERRVAAFGQLESAWPVHGTVLVADGVAYVAAGRSTYLDGGIHVYALEPETGRLIRTLEPVGGKSDGLEDVLVGDGGSVYMRHLKFSLKGDGLEGGGAPARGKKGRSQSSVSSRAFSTAGLLDDSWFSRVGWGGGGKSGGAELLVFDDESTYTIRTRRQGGFGGWFKVAAGAYELTALDKNLKKPRWSETIPIRVRAMVAAGKTLFVAGPPDAAESSDPWAAFEGRKGGLLRAVSVSDGTHLAECRLDAPPVYDGMAAAGGRLYLSTVDGKIVCMQGRK